MLRTGLIAKKLGMTRLFMEDGRQIPVTVLALENLQVVAQRTPERDGYTAVQLGAGTAKVKRVSAPMRGHFAKANVEPKRKVAEFRVATENMIAVGEEITANHYFAGQFVDISSVRIRAASLKVKRWPVTWAPLVLPPRTCRSSRPTPIAA